MYQSISKEGDSHIGDYKLTIIQQVSEHDKFK